MSNIKLPSDPTNSTAKMKLYDPTQELLYMKINILVIGGQDRNYPTVHILVNGYDSYVTQFICDSTIKENTALVWAAA